jgi:hypothetical protein
MDRNEIERKVTQSSGDLAELNAALGRLQARVDRHALVIGVLKDLLLARDEFTEDEFLQRLEQAITRKKVERNACPRCGKAMSAKHNRCMYCGEGRPPELV